MTLFEKSAEHLGLLQDMIKCTDAGLLTDHSVSGAANLQSAIVSCLACEHVDECALWLKEVEGEVAPPKFCANAERLKNSVS